MNKWEIEYLRRWGVSAVTDTTWYEFLPGDLVELRAFLDIRTLHSRDGKKCANIFLSFDRIVRLASGNLFTEASYPFCDTASSRFPTYYDTIRYGESLTSLRAIRT